MVDGKEVFSLSERSLALLYSNKSLKVRKESEESGYGIRVLRSGGLGFSYAESEDELKKAEARAAALAKFSPRPGFAFPGKQKCPKLALNDKKVEDMDAMQLKEMYEQIREGAEKHGGNAQLTLQVGSGSVALENSAGFSGEYKSTGVQFGVEVMDGDGYGLYSNAFVSLPSAKEFYKMGEEAAEQAKDMKSPKKMQSGKYVVVFEPEALDDLFDILLPSFNGDWKRRKISFLHDKLGQQVFDSKLSIHDDPLREDAVNSEPFDGEGTTAAKLPLVEKGIVKNFIYNIETAALEGIKAGGKCSRSSYDSTPGIGFSNLVIAPGDLGEDEGELSVYAFHGTHTANTTTGDFGVEVSTAFLTKNRKREPVRGFMLTGNIFNLFKNIYGIGKKQKKLGSFIAPRIGFSDLQVIA